jgi:Methylamine utilisation protein MauE
MQAPERLGRSQLGAGNALARPRVTVGWAAAIALGGVLLLSGALKVVGRPVWRAQAAELGVPRAVAAVVPFVELVLGGLLVVDVLRHDAAVLAGLLLIGFTAFIVRLLRRGSRAPCACFGSLSRSELGWSAVVRNLVLIALAVVAAVA